MSITIEQRNGKIILVKVAANKNESPSDYLGRIFTRIDSEVKAKHGTLKKYLLGCTAGKNKNPCEKCSLEYNRSKLIKPAREYLQREYSVTAKQAKAFLNKKVDSGYSTKFIDVWELDQPKFRALAVSFFDMETL